jgi:hypothetical protein
VLGFTIGVDREVTAAEADTYLQALDGISDRVRIELVGLSTEGRPIRAALVGAPENLTDPGLDAVRTSIAALRDPQTPKSQARSLAASTPAFLWVIGNVHGSEESGTDMGLRLIYELADREDCVAETIAANAVVVFVPCQNPDGRELDQRRNVYGFDLNRDLFARTQMETDDRVELMRRYPPQLLVDDHEFGYYRAFFPPVADPVYHEAPEIGMRWMSRIYGKAIARRFRANDWPFFNGGIYDFFSPQYNDTTTTFGFLGTGMTIEVYNGSPLSKRFDRHRTVALTSLWAAATRRPKLLRRWHESYVEATAQGRKGRLEPNRRYFFPDRRIRRTVPKAPLRHYFVLDTPAKRRENRMLVRRLQRMDVHVYRLDRALRVPDFRPYSLKPRSKTLPAGTFWIPMAQGQKHWIQALLHERPYMPTAFTYGLSGWSSALAMNVDGGSSGTKLQPVATEVDPLPAPSAPVPPSEPRIGLYAMSDGSYAYESAGATRWLFDVVWQIPYTEVTKSGIQTGALDDIDVLVVPGGDFPTAMRRLGETGQQALRDWVNGGGRYVGYRGGGAKLAAALGLTTAVLRDPKADVPGSLVKVLVDRSSPLGKGVGESVWLLMKNDDVMHAPRAIAPLRFPASASKGFFISGDGDDVKQLHGTAAVVDEVVGAGRVVIFPSDPNFAGHVEGMTKVLWNAIFGPDPQRRGEAPRAGSPERREAERTARLAVTTRPDDAAALRLAVPATASAEAATAGLLRGHGAKFRVARSGDRTSFVIENPRELTAEEHPWITDVVVRLQERGVEVLGFSSP